jgi:glycosyltransferase involved in cell wall biosynthesis
MSEPSIRVLHLIGSLERGGTEHQLVQMIRRSPADVRHGVVLFDSIGPLAEELVEPPVFVGPLRGPGRVPDPTVLLRLRRVIALSAPDLVHAHLTLSELLAALGTPRGVPIVASRRGRPSPNERRRWLRPATALAHRRVRTLLCNTKQLAREALETDPWTPEIVVIPNGVDLDRYAYAPMPPGPPTVAIVANLRRYKRHELFLAAFAEVRERCPDARALIVGDGPEMERLRRTATDLGIAPATSFTGSVADPRREIARAHVVALTSEHEGLPNALLEAMAMGRPVVSTAVGGVPELIRDGIDGFLVPDDPAAIAERIAGLLLDKAEAERIGSAARERAAAYGWDAVVERTIEVYRRILDVRAPVLEGQVR